VTARGGVLLGGILLLGVTAAAAPTASAQSAPAETSVTTQPAEPPPGPLLAHHPEQGPHPVPGALTAAPEEKSPNTGPVSLAIGADWVSDYYFRGILFQPGDNVQQYLEVRFRLLEDAGPLTSLTLAGGNWNDFRSGGDSNSDPRWWFEANLYARLTALWWNVLTTGVTFTYYDSPSNSFRSQSDIAVNVALNDTKWLGAFALNPSIVFAFQTHNHFVPTAKDDGIFMGLGLAPGYTFWKDSRLPLNVSLPMTFGFSVRDYYTTADGKNQTWGYFQGGPQFTTPLKFLGRAFGDWTFKAGVQFLELGENLRQIDGRTNKNGYVPIGNVGFSMTY
jgi:hypothetical protein